MKTIKSEILEQNRWIKELLYKKYTPKQISETMNISINIIDKRISKYNLMMSSGDSSYNKPEKDMSFYYPSPEQTKTSN